MEITPNSKEGWAVIKWATAEIHVRKLQKRIYLASKLGNVKLLRKLQHSLINSFHAKLIATRRVTQDNTGKKTAGVDGISKLTPAARLVLAKKLKLATVSSPVRRVWIEKPGRKEKRPLGIPTMEDRARQSLFKLALEPEWEAKFEHHSYGFRPGRCAHDAMKQIYLSINKMPKYVLDADIRKCFDRIDHKKLLQKLGFKKGIFYKQIKAWLTCGVIDAGAFSATEMGSPQGDVISPLLANIALHGMETMLKDLMDTIPLKTPQGRPMGSRDKRRSLSIIRYADDFVVMHYDKNVILKCKTALTAWLKEIGLELSEEKTRITHTLYLSPLEQEELGCVKPGFDFLGFTVRQFKSKYRSGNLPIDVNTLIIPSVKKCKTFQANLFLAIRKCHNVPQEVIIKKLNPIICGWARYFGISDASTCGVFQKMDWLLYLKLRRWAKRRTKKASSSLKKYWKKLSVGGWTFITDTDVKLNSCTDYAGSIRDYVKVKGESSPFDGNEMYWSTRLGVNPLMSKSQSLLLKRQRGKCRLCNLYFADGEILEIDHIIPRAEGGEKSYNNIQLVHRHCHDQKAILSKSETPPAKPLASKGVAPEPKVNS